MKKPVRIAITGAAGQISYSLVFQIASGLMLGHDQPIILQLLELPAAMPALQGVMMELDDCAFPLLHQVIATADPKEVFADIDYALLVGAKPRSKDMQRADLLTVNAQIFVEQGRAINDVAKPTAKILVVGNPANTNAWIVDQVTPNLNPRQVHSMMRLDQNRLIGQLAHKLGCELSKLARVTVWGNHSATQFPDVRFATLNQVEIYPHLDEEWIEKQLIPTVQTRGTKVIAARGASSAASAAHAAICHIRDWELGANSRQQWSSMGVVSEGEYGVPEGMVFGFPCYCSGEGEWHIIDDLPVDAESQEQISANIRELEQEQQMASQVLQQLTKN